ncbi:hypothetical protein [Citrobacter portucalensis]|uniref:hypothetical protein n=1 Tax=Citrobacter portucalensis TaxID=1639133 RepID=UPI00226B3BE1|nr:hypothetical protein [Citrobacter portucalensis]MCX8986116.1 hypothetical protein [Citrobacter portucalensis]
MKKIIILLPAFLLISCATKPKDTVDSIGYVYIYSTSSVAIARDRADKLCGSHAFFLDSNYPRRNYTYYTEQHPSIPFNCNLEQAAYEGSTEAKEIKMKNIESAYKDYYKAQYQLKEIRRKNANPAKYESYTETDPDGTIRSYSFHDNKSCETVVTVNGKAETKCD